MKVNFSTQNTSTIRQKNPAQKRGLVYPGPQEPKTIDLQSALTQHKPSFLNK